MDSIDVGDVGTYGQRVFDGRRGRKQPKRKCVDFNSTLIRHVHRRALFRDYRDLEDLQPSLPYDKDVSFLMWISHKGAL